MNEATLNLSRFGHALEKSVRLLFWGAFIAVTANLQAADGDTDFHAAGVILFAETPVGISLLLADHELSSSRGWAAFGGAREPGESPAETAARETEEETRGFFKREMLMQALKDKPPLVDGGYAFYFVKVDKVPVSDIENKWFPPWKLAFWERGPYAWIPYFEIERFLNLGAVSQPLRINPQYLPQNKHTDWIWPLWLGNLRVAAAAQALPWTQDPQRLEENFSPNRSHAEFVTH